MLEKFYRFNEVTGISITVLSGEKADINACSITVSQNQLDFEKKITSIQSVGELAGQFPAKTIVALNLSGRGVLQKQIEKTEEINQSNFVKILPNASIDDFYVQNFISGDKSFVSVIRKTEANKWIHQLRALGFMPVMLSLGPFPVQNIISQINIYGTEVIFHGHSIIRNEQMEWVSCSYDESALAPFPLKVESETISEKLLIAYASAFQLVLANKISSINAEVADLTIALQKQLVDKKLKVQGFIVLSVFFVLLLVNFFVFSGLNNSNALLTEQVSRSAQSSDDVQKINEQVLQKEALLKTLGYEGPVNKSVLIDQAASLLPGDITWKEAAVDPINHTDSRSQKSIVFFEQRIIFIGTSDEIIPVNEWIARLKTLKWVKNATLDSYTINNELNTGQFMIIIDY